MKSQRDGSIELYRALLMLGICVIHCSNQSTYYQSCFGYIQNGTLWCVDGFVFLSGWYGIRFRVGKLLRLYGVGVASALIGTFIAKSCGMCSEISFLFFTWRTFCGYWFLHAYVVLMLLAPLLNEMFETAHSPGRNRVVLTGCFGVVCLLRNA